MFGVPIAIVLALAGFYVVLPRQPSEPLEMAIHMGHLDVVRGHMKFGIKYDEESISGETLTPLFYAAQENQPQIVQMFLDSGAKPNAPTLTLTPAQWKNKKRAGGQVTGGETPLMGACEILSAEEVKILLDHGADPNIESPMGETALSKAMFNVRRDRGIVVLDDAKNRREIARMLFEHKADPNKGVHRKNPAVLGAVLEPDAEIVKMFIAHGVGLDAKNASGWTLMHGAPDKKTVEALIAKGVDVNAKTVYGVTPLMSVVTADATEALIAHGANVAAKSNDGSSALHWAAKLIPIDEATATENAKRMQVLLSHHADLEAKDDVDRTPLYYAVMWDWKDATKANVDFLRKAGAVGPPPNKNGKTAEETNNQRAKPVPGPAGG